MSEHLPPKIMKSATYSSAGTVGARLLAALTGILIARAVGPAPLGVYAAMWALVELSISLTEIGMITGLKREGSRSPELIPHLLGNAIAVRGAVGLAALSVALVARSALSQSDLAPHIFPPLALAGFSILCAEPLFAVLQVRGEQKLVALFMVGRGFAFLGGIAALAFLGFDVVVLAWYQGGLYAIATALLATILISRTSIRLKMSYVVAQIRGAFSFGVSEILHATYLSIPLLAMSRFGSEEETGYFAVAQRFVMLCVAVGAAANHEAFLPALFRLFKRNREQFALVCAMSQRALVAMGILGASALYTFAETLVVVLQGEAYRPAVGVLRLLCWAVALMYGSLAADSALTASDNMRPKIAIQAAAAASMLILAFLLVPRYGVSGACGMALIVTFGVLTLTVLSARKRHVLPFSGLTGILLRSGATVACALFIVALMPGSRFWGPMAFIAIAGGLWRSYAREEMARGACVN